jgi:hypothetical protein
VAGHGRRSAERSSSGLLRRSEGGYGYPAFVDYPTARLRQGYGAQAFARLRCPTCGFERLVAFSCKGRVCPSCWARRTAETAADLVDRVLPQAPYRQWVLTFPWELRFLLAVEPDFLSEMLAAFLRTVFANRSRFRLWPGGHEARPASASTRRRYEPRRLPPRAPP